MASNIEENRFLVRVLEILSQLVKYGYYDDPQDVEVVLISLVEVINGFSDGPFHLLGQSSQADGKDVWDE